jgi:hypothetical protein
VIGLITRCLVDMAAVMDHVFALVYNFHMPLSSKVKLFVQRTWLLCNLGFFLLACWSGGNFFYFLVLRLFRFFLLVCICCFFAVVWCVSAAGGVFACSGFTVCRVLSRLCCEGLTEQPVIVVTCREIWYLVVHYNL